MATYSQLNKRLSHVGIPINKRFILVVESDRHYEVSFRSTLEASYGLNYPIGQLRISEFYLGILLDNGVGNPIYIVDTEKQGNEYDIEDALRLLAHAPIYIENLFFFNIQKPSTNRFMRLRDVLSLDVVTPGYATVNVKAGRLEYIYDEFIQMELSEEERDIERNSMVHGMSDSASRSLRIQCTNQLEILKNGKDINIDELLNYLPESKK